MAKQFPTMDDDNLSDADVSAMADRLVRQAEAAHRIFARRVMRGIVLLENHANKMGDA